MFLILFRSVLFQMLVVIVLCSIGSILCDPYFPGHNHGCNDGVSATDPPDTSLVFQQRGEHCYKPSTSCHDMPAVCLECPIPTQSCSYGSTVKVTCTPHKDTRCGSYSNDNNLPIERDVTCTHCFQTLPHQHTCMPTCTKCLSVDTPRQRYLANCTVNYDTYCAGSRTFYVMKLCGFTTGYKWSTAFVLSLTLGGFGVDRFYLGYWKEGLGKLFSFGGLGIWTMVDAVLISVGYITPADGSLYM